MKKVVLIISIILFYACQNKKQPKEESLNEETNNIGNSPFYKEMDSLYKTAVFNGYSATIVDTSGIVYNRGFGYANLSEQKKYTDQSLINIASISKVFIGIALMKAEELNFIDLDDPINKHLPFKVINPNLPKDHITIRHLATHTSSIVDTDTYLESCYVNKDDTPIADHLQEKYGSYYQNPSTDWMPLAEYLRKLLAKGEEFYSPSTFVNRKAGDTYEYSNVGAALSALVIEQASNMPFNEFTKEMIFNPLEMSSTAWFYEEVDSSRYSKLFADKDELPYYRILTYPDGGLITSSTDLGKFLVELIKGYTGNGTILNPSSYQEIFRSQLEESAFGGKENFNVGLFLEKELAHHVIGHTGGDPGTNTMMYFDTETKRGKIFITNTDSKKENSDAVMWGIWNALDIYD